MAEIIVRNQDKRFQTLLDCSARFAGEHGSRKIQRFLDFIAAYKDVKRIKDEQALEELGHLLTNSAHDWWLRRKHHFLNWSETLTALQKHFSRQRPAHAIYAEIFGRSFDKYLQAEDFIYDKYELFHELPQPLPSERMQLDIIYALLPEEKRRNINHVNIMTVMDLMECVQDLQSNDITTVSTQHPNITMNNSKQCNADIKIKSPKAKEETKEIEIVCDESNPQKQKKRLEEANESVDITLVQDRDPIIKVRRTEDLMPTIRDNKEIRAVQPQETNEKTTPPFQLASESINQIDHIINLCGNENDLPTNIGGLGVSITSVADASQITYLLNGETTIAPEIVTPNQQQTFAKDKKPKIRYKLSRPFGSKFDINPKKVKYTKLVPERLKNTKKNTETITQSHCENVQSATGNTNIVMGAASMPDISSTNISQTISQSPTISPSTPTTSTASNHTISNTLTTKLIDPINGPFSTKAAAAKMRLNAGTSPNAKCHQCGTIGFYRSICPNCSPIYFYKPPNNAFEYRELVPGRILISYLLTVKTKKSRLILLLL
uniref:Retrotransposon gag domain-containing protein n=1 Tax=Glossina austeni TaxID=7395 RepID=A0A1A9UHZ4_GLOAU